MSRVSGVERCSYHSGPPLSGHLPPVFRWKLSSWYIPRRLLPMGDGGPVSPGERGGKPPSPPHSCSWRSTLSGLSHCLPASSPLLEQEVIPHIAEVRAFFSPGCPSPPEDWLGSSLRPHSATNCPRPLERLWLSPALPFEALGWDCRLDSGPWR